jgi:hypothetical protein
MSRLLPGYSLLTPLMQTVVREHSDQERRWQSDLWSGSQVLYRSKYGPLLRGFKAPMSAQLLRAKYLSQTCLGRGVQSRVWVQRRTSIQNLHLLCASDTEQDPDLWHSGSEGSSSYRRLQPTQADAFAVVDRPDGGGWPLPHQQEAGQRHPSGDLPTIPDLEAISKHQCTFVSRLGPCNFGRGSALGDQWGIG